jgi:hypothetical protein
MAANAGRMSKSWHPHRSQRRQQARCPPPPCPLRRSRPASCPLLLPPAPAKRTPPLLQGQGSCSSLRKNAAMVVGARHTCTFSECALIRLRASFVVQVFAVLCPLSSVVLCALVCSLAPCYSERREQGTNRVDPRAHRPMVQTASLRAFPLPSPPCCLLLFAALCLLLLSCPSLLSASRQFSLTGAAQGGTDRAQGNNGTTHNGREAIEMGCAGSSTRRCARILLPVLLRCGLPAASLFFSAALTACLVSIAPQHSGTHTHAMSRPPRPTIAPGSGGGVMSGGAAGSQSPHRPPHDSSASPAGAAGTSSTSSEWPASFPSWQEPPQASYGWFVDVPPPRGPFLWPCLPDKSDRHIKSTDRLQFLQVRRRSCSTACSVTDLWRACACALLSVSSCARGRSPRAAVVAAVTRSVLQATSRCWNTTHNWCGDGQSDRMIVHSRAIAGASRPGC